MTKTETGRQAYISILNLLLPSGRKLSPAGVAACGRYAPTTPAFAPSKVRVAAYPTSTHGMIRRDAFRFLSNVLNAHRAQTAGVLDVKDILDSPTRWTNQHEDAWISRVAANELISSSYLACLYDRVERMSLEI